jgi:Uma2 family endonuclease
MGQPAIRSATYEDLLEVPEHLVAEIIHGVLYTHPRPAPRHSLSAAGVAGKLFDPYGTGRGGPGGWWILDDPEVHLGPQRLVPDRAGWGRERLPALPETAWLGLAPDWVCEILSPSTAKNDRTLKLPIYAHEGVRNLWFVDPLLRTLEAFRLADGHWVLESVRKDEDQARLAPFDAVEFPLGDLWA